MEIFWCLEVFSILFALCILIDWSLEGYYFLRAICAKRDLNKYGVGSWALITGSTDEIGLGFAKVLAKYGFNIVSIARNPEKLRNAEREIKVYPVKVISIIKDFSNCPENPSEFFNEIDAQTRDLDISIVINNVGTSLTGHFHEHSVHDILNINAVNLWPIVYLSKIYLQRMFTRNQPSAFINLSSTSALVPFAGSSLYSSEKSFDNLFTLYLIEEIRYMV